MKDDYLLVECNTRSINDFNHELGNTLNTASNALQNFANQVGFNINQNNNFNLPTISEDAVGCAKLVLKRMYILEFYIITYSTVFMIILLILFKVLTQWFLTLFTRRHPNLDP